MAIHGIGSTWQVWEPVLPTLEARHDVLSLSLPGFGESPALVGQPTVPALVDSVEDAMDAAGIARAHLVGNSLGGWITAELAARGRARSVAAICPAGLWTPREMRYATTVLNSSTRPRYGWSRTPSASAPTPSGGAWPSARWRRGQSASTRSRRSTKSG